MKLDVFKTIVKYIPSEQAMLLSRRYGVPLLNMIQENFKNVLVFNMAKALDINEMTKELEKHKNEAITLVIDNFNAKGRNSDIDALTRFVFSEVHSNRELYLHRASRIIFIVNKSIVNDEYDNNNFDMAAFSRLWVANITK